MHGNGTWSWHRAEWAATQEKNIRQNYIFIGNKQQQSHTNTRINANRASSTKKEEKKSRKNLHFLFYRRLSLCAVNAQRTHCNSEHSETRNAKSNKRYENPWTERTTTTKQPKRPAIGAECEWVVGFVAWQMPKGNVTTNGTKARRNMQIE